VWFDSSSVTSDSSNSVVTAALTEVSGVRKSCVTASSNADFNRTLCSKTSAWGAFGGGYVFIIQTLDSTKTPANSGAIDGAR
jgi:hypothetical protein